MADLSVQRQRTCKLDAHRQYKHEILSLSFQHCPRFLLAFRGDYTFSIVKEAASLSNLRAMHLQCTVSGLQDDLGIFTDLHCEVH